MQRHSLSWSSLRPFRYGGLRYGRRGFNRQVMTNELHMVWVPLQRRSIRLVRGGPLEWRKIGDNIYARA